MRGAVAIRAGTAADLPALERLYAAAFPDEDLRPLLRDLLGATAGVLSLVAEAPGDRDAAGHVAVTPCAIEGDAATAALLGPLAVRPARQRRGIGRALVRAALARLGESPAARVCVLGDPAFYARFGFAPETGILPPHPLPEAWRTAWQSVALGRPGPRPEGRLRPPPPWRRAELWAP